VAAATKSWQVLVGKRRISLTQKVEDTLPEMYPRLYKANYGEKLGGKKPGLFS